MNTKQLHLAFEFQTVPRNSSRRKTQALVRTNENQKPISSNHTPTKQICKNKTERYICKDTPHIHTCALKKVLLIFCLFLPSQSIEALPLNKFKFCERTLGALQSEAQGVFLYRMERALSGSRPLRHALASSSTPYLSLKANSACISSQVAISSNYQPHWNK